MDLHKSISNSDCPQSDDLLKLIFTNQFTISSCPQSDEL